MGTGGRTGQSTAMANYVLSHAFCDQVFLTYARAALDGLRETAGDAVKRVAARLAQEHRARGLRRALRALDRHILQDIGQV